MAEPGLSLVARIRNLTGMNAERLTLTEATRLTEIESKIERHIDQWRTVAQGLAEIRDNRLYRADDKSFDSYLQRKWGLTAASAYRLIRSENAAANVAHMATLSQREARELSKLPADQQTAALEKAGGASARLADLERTIEAARPPRRRRARGRVKPKPVIFRGSGWRLTIELRHADLEPVSILHQVLAQIAERREAA